MGRVADGSVGMLNNHPTINPYDLNPSLFLPESILDKKLTLASLEDIQSSIDSSIEQIVSDYEDLEDKYDG